MTTTGSEHTCINAVNSDVGWYIFKDAGAAEEPLHLVVGRSSCSSSRPPALSSAALATSWVELATTSADAQDSAEISSAHLAAAEAAAQQHQQQLLEWCAAARTWWHRGERPEGNAVTSALTSVLREIWEQEFLAFSENAAQALPFEE
jgi:hypothetical protein